MVLFLAVLAVKTADSEKRAVAVQQSGAAVRDLQAQLDAAHERERSLEAALWRELQVLRDQHADAIKQVSEAVSAEREEADRQFHLKIETMQNEHRAETDKLTHALSLQVSVLMFVFTSSRFDCQSLCLTFIVCLSRGLKHMYRHLNSTRLMFSECKKHLKIKSVRML